MGNLLNNILGFLTSPIGFVVIFGVVGGLGRLGAWLSQERARRAAIQARARREAENLRTGRPIAMGELRNPQPTIARADPSRQESEDAARQRALQEERTAQLRALQQKRLAELRAKRAQQAAGGATAAPPQQQARRPGTAPARNTPPPAQARPRPTPRPPMQTPSQGPLQTRDAQTRRTQQARPVMPPPSALTATPAAPEPTARPVDATEIGGPASRPIGAPRGAPYGGAVMLAHREDLRRAIIFSEILGPPVAERDPDRPGIF